MDYNQQHSSQSLQDASDSSLEHSQPYHVDPHHGNLSSESTSTSPPLVPAFLPLVQHHTIQQNGSDGQTSALYPHIYATATNSTLSPASSSVLSPVDSFTTPALSTGTMSTALSSSFGGDPSSVHSHFDTPAIAGDVLRGQEEYNLGYDLYSTSPALGLGVSGVFHHQFGNDPSSGTKSHLPPPQTLHHIPPPPASSSNISDSLSPQMPQGSTTSERVFINPPTLLDVQSPGNYAPSTESVARESTSSQKRKRASEQTISIRSRGLPPLQTVSRKGHEIGLDLGDFDMLETLGTGTFGRVILSRLRTSPRRPAQRYPHYFAMKVLEKVTVVRLRQVEHLNSERSTLAQVSHPFIVNMLCTFQDEQNLYILLEYVQGGELFSHLRRAGRFSPDVARFYTANLILALEYLHSRDIIYRDLKPENLLIDASGYLKITDFGFAKHVPDRTYTLCGTPEYLAPEIITATGHGSAADWWALGVLIFELLAGFPPFFADNPLEIYERILQNKFVFPAHVDFVAKDLVKRLLAADLTKRLGNLKGGARDVKAHRWFEGVDWEAVERKEIRAPIIPLASSPSDTSNFERYPHRPIETLPGVLRAQRARQYGISPDLLEPSGPDMYSYLFPQFCELAERPDRRTLCQSITDRQL